MARLYIINEVIMNEESLAVHIDNPFQLPPFKIRKKNLKRLIFIKKAACVVKDISNIVLSNNDRKKNYFRNLVLVIKRVIFNPQISLFIKNEW